MRTDRSTPPAAKLAVLASFLTLIAGTTAPIAGAAGIQPSPAARAGATAASIDLIELTGLLDPSSVGFLFDQIDQAERDRSSALVVRVDSPGAVGVSAGRITGKVTGAGIPVVVWVAPGEAAAHSASALLLAAADIGVMAPHASIGPASAQPIVNSTTPAGRRQAENRTLSAVLRRKMNPRDASALQRRPFTADQAEQAGLVDFQAASLPELLQGLGGRQADVGEKTVSIPEGPFSPRFHKMSLLGRLLHGSARPPAAYLLLLAGVFAILFELYNPGVGGAALTGGIAVGFSLYGFAILPTTWLGVALILVALAALSADLQGSGLGPMTLGGLVVLLAGSLLTFSGAPPAMQLPVWSILAGIAGALLFLFGVLPAAIRSRIARPLAGAENIVGTHGIARTDVAPEGQVMARGTLWRARTLGAAIAQGQPVEIRGVAGLMLMVEPAGQPARGSEHPPAGE